MYGKKENKFLFILCPPFCGSTLLHELVSTSLHVSANNVLGNREGQSLPTVRKIMFDHNERWNEDKKYPWNFIKKEWLKYWDLTKKVLIEKSPPNIIRAADIEKIFEPAFFICMVRNPYAHCESIIRRHKKNPKDAALFSVKCLWYQKKNIENLKRVIFFKYEDLVISPENIKEKIIHFIPELEDITLNHTFHAHNFKKIPMKITNLNDEKISQLTQEQLNGINQIFESEREILQYFNYDLIKTLPNS